MKRFRSFQSDSEDVNQVQDAVKVVLDDLNSNPLLSSILLENISLATGDNQVPHSLNRPLRGWIVVRRDSVAVIFDKQSQNPLAHLTLLLNASAACTVSLLVF